jgi:hypothetical protein
MAYHHFKADDGSAIGSFETFHMTQKDARQCFGPEYDAGWYWWACFPGCMPDGEPSGPYATEQEAIDNAQENS